MIGGDGNPDSKVSLLLDIEWNLSLLVHSLYNIQGKTDQWRLVINCHILTQQMLSTKVNQFPYSCENSKVGFTLNARPSWVNFKLSVSWRPLQIKVCTLLIWQYFRFIMLLSINKRGEHRNIPKHVNVEYLCCIKLDKYTRGTSQLQDIDIILHAYRNSGIIRFSSAHLDGLVLMPHLR